MSKAWGPTTTRTTRRATPTPGLETGAAPAQPPIARQHVVAPAPSVGVLPQPLGDLSRTSSGELVKALSDAWPGSEASKARRRAAVRSITATLSACPGETWQERWSNSAWGAETATLSSGKTDDASWWSYAMGFKYLAAGRVIVPSVRMLRADAPADYPELFRVAQHDPQLDEVLTRLEIAAGRTTAHRLRRLRCALVFSLTSQGVGLQDLTPAGLLHYSEQLRQAIKAPSKALAGTLVWDVLLEMGIFPAGTPATMRLAQRGGQRTITEMVDAYGVRNLAVRQLLIDYISHRAVAGMDYTTSVSLTCNLVRNFWCLIEDINPAQADLRLDEATANAWRARIDTVSNRDGTVRPRGDLWSILMTVRGLYLDLQSWAVDDPARWAVWVAPSPIAATQARAYQSSRRRLSERMADRTRLRQPVLDLLVDYATGRRRHLQAVHAAARGAAAGSPQPKEPVEIRVDGVDYTVLPGSARADPNRRRVRAAATGKTFIPGAAAERAFWAWAIVNILRLTGIRQEELLELSQLSIRRYQRPNGETVALLVIAPSKTDRERVIPISGELLHVLAEVVRFLTRDGHPIPLVRRWDPYERQHTPALPYLFQPSNGPFPAVASPTWVRTLLLEACAGAASEHPELDGLMFTSHDFRRIFATDLVNNGLPIHIGAALLGHADLQTTRGYVAVFDDDLVRHYQQYLDRRRTLRPPDEYRPATTSEWAEFEQHFDKRKVELGNCTRPYGTPCVHEHACLRCPMLDVNPAMVYRLDELEDDLLTRRTEAERRGWLGEAEGIDQTLQHLQRKRNRSIVSGGRSIVHLGMPTQGPAGADL